MDPLYNKTVFSTQYRLSHLKKSGGHLPNDLAKLINSDEETNGITVWEMGNLIEVNYGDVEKKDGGQGVMHLWTVVRVLQHTTPATAASKNHDLNLSSDDSLSAGSLEDDVSNDSIDQNETRASASLELNNFSM